MAQGIIDALRHDHDEVRKMFARLDAAAGEQRRELFQQLVSELVRHEVAEEEILRPVSKRDAGAAIANARIKEESQAEELLKEMEKLDPGSAVVLYTDGLVEATNVHGEEFGEVRLSDFINAHENVSAEQLAERLLEEVLSWPGNGNSHPQADDITIVVIDIGR